MAEECIAPYHSKNRVEAPDRGSMAKRETWQGDFRPDSTPLRPETRGHRQRRTLRDRQLSGLRKAPRQSIPATAGGEAHSAEAVKHRGWAEEQANLDRADFPAAGRLRYAVAPRSAWLRRGARIAAAPGGYATTSER